MNNRDSGQDVKHSLPTFTFLYSLWIILRFGYFYPLNYLISNQLFLFKRKAKELQYWVGKKREKHRTKLLPFSWAASPSQSNFSIFLLAVLPSASSANPKSIHMLPLHTASLQLSLEGKQYWERNFREFVTKCASVTIWVTVVRKDKYLCGRRLQEHFGGSSLLCFHKCYRRLDSELGTAP